MPGIVAGQEPPIWTVVDAEMCARAIQISRDAVSRERAYALNHLSLCGAEGGAALAQELRQLRDISDVPAMQRTFVEIARIRDAQVVEAALELAADQTATVEARVAAFRIFVEYADPSTTTTFGYFMLPRSSTLEIVGQDVGKRAGLPLPDNWRESVRAVLIRIIEDPSESESMRYGAERAMLEFRAP